MSTAGSKEGGVRRRALAALLAVALFSIAMMGNLAEARPRPVFSGVPGEAVTQPGGRTTEKRKRRVDIDLSALADASFPDGTASVVLNLFPDLDLTAVKTRFERRGSRGFSWFGKVQGDSQSAVVLTTGGGLMYGLVFADGRHFEIRGSSAATQEVVEIDQSAFPPEGCDQISAGDPSQIVPPLPATQDALGDSGAVIDVLVVYTPAVRTAEGGTAAIQLRAQISVDATNNSYFNSGIAPRLNLVLAAEVSYTESADNLSGWNLDLSRLVGNGDGHLDTVHALRDTYRADVVVLLVRDSGLYCGLAGAIMANASTAFSLVARSCATSNFSFAHEIGHLQGARHDLYVDPTLGSPYDYNHGHVNLTYRRRTVMAYNDECAATSPYTYCDRVSFWSNPGVDYPSTTAPTGTVARENNALVLNNTAATVANFLQRSKTLTVQSTYPAVGVPITVVPTDNDALGDGSTAFQRTYFNGTGVSLTAPATADDNPFVGWVGCASVGGPGNRTCAVTLDDNKTVTANYFRDTVLRPTSFALVTRSDTGQAAIRELEPSSGVLQNAVWIFSPSGVGAPWEATSFSRVDASTGYVLWTRSDTGQASLWKINPGTGAVTSMAHVYSSSGVGAPWRATSYAHVDSSTGYLLWTRSDTGQAILWRIDPGAMPGIIPVRSMAHIYSSSGVGGPWQATSYQQAGPSTGYLLWTRGDTGQAILWRVDPSAMPGIIPATSMAHVSSSTGVGGPWQATSYQQTGPTTGYLLWTRNDTGQAVLYRVDPSVMPAVIPATTLWSSTAGAPYQATCYIPVNQSPTLDALGPVTITEDYGIYSISLSGITAGSSESQPITVTATSDNTGLIPTPTVSYTSPGTGGSVSFAPVANASGTATITVWVNDGQAANNPVSRSFTVTVTPVNNDPPTDISLSTNSVDGNLDAGTAVGTFSTADVDIGDTFLYELVIGSGSTNNASFTIDGNVLKTSEPLDFTATNPYSIRVKSTDQGGAGAATEKIFTVVPASYVLWSRSDTGQVVLWQLDSGTGTVRRMLYVFSASGVGPPWQATSYAHVNGKEGYVLWSRSDTGQAGLWKIDPRNGTVSSMAHVFSASGVGGPWQATSYAHVSAGEGYVLWSRSDTGQADLWKVNPGVPGVIPAVSMAHVFAASGVGGPWQATSYAHVSAGEGYVLWSRSDTGQAELWEVNPGVPGVIPAVRQAHVFSASGVGGPWQATSYQPALGDPTTGYLLWTRSDIGRADLWTVDPSVPGVIPPKSMEPVSPPSGVGGPWQVTSYVR